MVRILGMRGDVDLDQREHAFHNSRRCERGGVRDASKIQRLAKMSKCGRNLGPVAVSSPYLADC